LKENEKLKSDRGALRKQYMYGASGAGATGTGASGYGNKFNSSMFGQHLLNKAASKENTVGSSMVFTQGFSKFISDGGSATTDKVDPHSLPLAMKENQSTTVRGFLATPNPSAFLQKGSSSGAGSYKSGIGKHENGSTDETNSNN
jgi:hypothetical protein